MFARVEDGLEAVLRELRAREPIFHTAAFGLTAAERERVVAPGYWEVGASGRRYSREFILRLLEEKPPVDAAGAGWECLDFGLRRLGAAVSYTHLQYEAVLNTGGDTAQGDQARKYMKSAYNGKP